MSQATPGQQSQMSSKEHSQQQLLDEDWKTLGARHTHTTTSQPTTQTQQHSTHHHTTPPHHARTRGMAPPHCDEYRIQIGLSSRVTQTDLKFDQYGKADVLKPSIPTWASLFLGIPLVLAISGTLTPACVND